MYFLHLSDALLEHEDCQRHLVDSIFFERVDEVNIKHAIRLVLHRLAHDQIADAAARDWLRVISRIIETAHQPPHVNASNVVSSSFDSEALKSLCARSLSAGIREGGSPTEFVFDPPNRLDVGFAQLLETCFRIGTEEVVQLFAGLTGRWVLILRESLDNMSEDQVGYCCYNTHACLISVVPAASDSSPLVQVSQRKGSPEPT